MSSATIDAYPLSWPDGWPRRVPSQRKSSAYRIEFGAARDHLVRELRLMRARDVVLSSNVPVRRDGLPYASMSRQPDDPGVAVFWTDRKGEPKVIACDVWRTVRDNLHAVGLAVEYLRGLERTGATEILERAFDGFKRLPASSDHWGVLGIPKGSNRLLIIERYRELARVHHPDKGGDAAVMSSINAAYREALAEVGT